MKQHEAVIKAMEENGGYATFGYLYQNTLKIKECAWRTKTPFASIRRIVQDERYFFKIKPGLWALNSYRNTLPEHVILLKQPGRVTLEKYGHSYYQGLLVEIGNMEGYETFIPSQDKNKPFLGSILGNVARTTSCHQFGYERLVGKAKTVDVIWFNEREMPFTLFEVEHSTDIHNSLLKFLELQDFHSKFNIVADKARQKEFNSKINLSAFGAIKSRVKFIDYDEVSEWHNKTSQYDAYRQYLNK